MNGITTDSNGTLVLAELSLDDVTALLADNREKGVYEVVCKEFEKSGNVYTIVSADPRMAGREQAAIVQSLKLNLAKCKKDNADFADIKITKKGDHTLLVNVAAHAAALEAAKAQAAIDAANADAE